QCARHGRVRRSVGGVGAHPRPAQHHAAAHRDPLQLRQLRGRSRRRLAPPPPRGPDARDQDGDRAHGLPAAAMTAMRSLPAMRASLARLRSTLWPDPASTTLGWWLVAIHLLLVLVVAGGISWYARGMLRDLGDEQAKARVQVAATTERVALLGARAPFGQTGQHVYVVRRLDQRLERALSAQVGADIRLIDYRAYTASSVNAFTPLYSAALADGHSAVQRIASQEVYA